MWPDWALVDGRKVQVGFELELCEACPTATERSSTVSAYQDWAATFDNLKRIARAIVPRGNAVATAQLLPYDHSLHESPRRGFRPEVTLTIRIRHSNGSDEPVDDCEKSYLRLMEQRLSERGIQRVN